MKQRILGSKRKRMYTKISSWQNDEKKIQNDAETVRSDRGKQNY